MAKAKQQYEIGLCSGPYSAAKQIIGPFATHKLAHDAQAYLNSLHPVNSRWCVAWHGELKRAPECIEEQPPAFLYPTSLARLARIVRETLASDPRVALNERDTDRVLFKQVEEEFGIGSYRRLLENGEVGMLVEYYRQ